MPGDATLQIHNQSPTYYWGNDRKALRQAIVKNRGDDAFKGLIAVALYAVKGDVGTARARMAAAGRAPSMKPDLMREMAEKLKKRAVLDEGHTSRPLSPEQKKQITDNHIWSNSIDALIAAPENPQVRAGVLRIMASMPRVEVTKTTTAGRPTLTVTDIWPAHGKFVETLVIDAATGRPVAFSGKAPNAPSRTIYYHTSRVTLADIKAGKF
jgi:hypothetical protein